MGSELRDVSAGPDHLVMHIVAVPTFMLRNVLAVIGAAMLAPILFFAGVVVLTVGTIGAQGRGHRFKSVPTQPFAGSVDLSKWLLVEQWVIFPRFVPSGGWRAELPRPANVAGGPPAGLPPARGPGRGGRPAGAGRRPGGLCTAGPRPAPWGVAARAPGIPPPPPAPGP